MSETGGGNQPQRIGTIIGVLAALLLLRRLRKRRKAKQLLKAKARAKARLVEQRMKEEKAREKAARKKGAKGGRGKKGKRDRSILEQLVRFTILYAMKKVIAQQIDQAGIELGQSKLGKKVVEAAEA